MYIISVSVLSRNQAINRLEQHTSVYFKLNKMSATGRKVISGCTSSAMSEVFMRHHLWFLAVRSHRVSRQTRP